MANYLYNGVELPALPEWDKTTYPYAVIAYESLYDYYQLWLSSTPLWTKTGSVHASADTKCILYNNYADPAVWRNIGESEAEGAWIFRPMWANYDFLYKDGTLYLAASDPVPVSTIDPTSLLMGYRVGQMIRMMRGKIAEPVAYLYNGVRLPKLPEWDREVYPYAVIRRSATTETAWLLISGQPLYCFWSTSEYTPDSSYIQIPAPHIMYRWTGGAEWGRYSGGNFHTNVGYYNKGDELPTMWANFDLAWDTGEIVVTASEPVPVYE